MTDKQLKKFLASVRRTRFVDYLDPLGETAQNALERRLQWARLSQGDPASSDEAQFLLDNADELREVLRRELDEDDWVEDTSAGREFEVGGRKKVRENDRVTEIFQSDDLRSGNTEVGAAPKRPSSPPAFAARPPLAARAPLPGDRPVSVSIRVGTAAPALFEEDEGEDLDDMPTGIMRMEDVTNPSLQSAIREHSPRPAPTRTVRAPSIPPRAAAKPKPKAATGPAQISVMGTRKPAAAPSRNVDPDDDTPSADPGWRGGRSTPPPPTPVPAPLRAAPKIDTPPPSIARQRTGSHAGVGPRVVLGTPPPAVPRIRPSEGMEVGPRRSSGFPMRLLAMALVGVVVVALIVGFALPTLVSWGRGDRVVVAEPVEVPSPVHVAPAPAPVVVAPAPEEPAVAPEPTVPTAPAPAPVTAAAPAPRPEPAPVAVAAPQPVAATPKPEPAPAVTAPAPAPAPVAAAAAVAPEVPAEPVEVPPAFPLKGTWASSSLKLTVRNQSGTSFDGTAELRLEDGTWVSVPVRGSVDEAGTLAFEGGDVSFGGKAKGGVASGNVIRGAGKDAEPVQLVRF
jgi:hypothetical protein